MTLLEQGAARRRPVDHTTRTRIELVSQGVISAYLRDISTHRAARGHASAGPGRIPIGSGPLRR